MSMTVEQSYVAEAQTLLRSIGVPKEVVSRLLSRVDSYASLQVDVDEDGFDNVRSVGVSVSFGERCGLHVAATDGRYCGVLIDLVVSFEPECVEATHLGVLVRLDDAIRHLVQQISELSCLGVWIVDGDAACTRGSVIFQAEEAAHE